MTEDERVHTFGTPINKGPFRGPDQVQWTYGLFPLRKDLEDSSSIMLYLQNTKTEEVMGVSLRYIIELLKEDARRWEPSDDEPSDDDL